MPAATIDLQDQAVQKRLSQQAQAIYDARLKPLLEPERNGEIVALHVDSGDYEVAETSTGARRSLRRRRPHGFIVTMDIGPVDPFDPLTLRMLGTQLLASREK